MAVHLADKLNTGLSPQQFIDGMQKNQEEFKRGYDAFAWDNDGDREFLKT